MTYQLFLFVMNNPQYNQDSHGVKIFKEHGGVLDRLDSIIFSGIGASVLIVLINNSWQVFR